MRHPKLIYIFIIYKPQLQNLQTNGIILPNYYKVPNTHNIIQIHNNVLWNNVSLTIHCYGSK